MNKQRKIEMATRMGAEMVNVFREIAEPMKKSQVLMEQQICTNLITLANKMEEKVAALIAEIELDQFPVPDIDKEETNRQYGSAGTVVDPIKLPTDSPSPDAPKEKGN